MLVTRDWATYEPMAAWETVNLPPLEAALAGPGQASFGHDRYPELPDKAAVLLYRMVKNHPWQNGNKRMALVSTFLFLGLNDHWWNASVEDAFGHLTWVAVSDAAAWEQAIGYLQRYFRSKIEALPSPTEL